MRKQSAWAFTSTWLVGLFVLLPSSGIASSTQGQFVTALDPSIKDELKWPDETAACQQSGKDLKISLGDIDSDSGRIEILIRNYADPHVRSQTFFKIDPNRNGEVRLLTQNGTLFQNWVYGDPKASCTVETKRANDVKNRKNMEVLVNCDHLSVDKDGLLLHNLIISKPIVCFNFPIY